MMLLTKGGIMDAVEGWLFAGSAVMVVGALTILALALAS
jgi:hypothetical protein